MAASPPAPAQARSAAGDGPVSLFLDTDLGTRLALLVAADSTICHLKSQVAVEHAAAFPDLGPVAVKSFQVRRKGAMYHLSDSMIVKSAFARVKAGCFLHVKMAAAVEDTHCCRDAPAMEDRGRSSEGCLGVDVDGHARELPATIPEIANDVLPEGLEGGEDAAMLNNVHAHDAVPNDMLLSSSSQLNTERKKNEAVSLASDVQTNSVPFIDKAKGYKQRIKHDNRTEGAYVNSTYVANVAISINQSNLSWVGEAHARKEVVLHSDGDDDVGFAPGSKQIGIKEEMLEETYALDNLSQEKGHKRARKSGSFNTSTADPIRETNESETRGVTKSDRVPLETNTNSCGELLNKSFQQEIHGNVQEDFIQLENASIGGKNKKRKKHQSVASKEAVSAQETTKPSTGAVEVRKAIGEVLLHKDNQGPQGDSACNVELNSRDKTMIRPSGMLLSSSQLNGSQGTKDVQLVSNAQATTDLVADLGNIEPVHKGSRNPTIGDTVNSTSEVVAGEGKSTKRSNTPWDGGEKHTREKRDIVDDGGHDEGVVETSNMEKARKGKNILEKIHTAGNTSQEKKRKKEKKVSSADIASLDNAAEKEQCGYGENATKSDLVSTQREIVDDPFEQQISSNVQQGYSNAIENPSGDGKRKKKRRHRLETIKGTVPTQDVTKSSELITNESSIQNTNAVPLDAKQTTGGTIGEATVSDRKKLDESLDIATASVIDEVLADLRSMDSLSKDSEGDLLTEQTHLGNSRNVLGLLGNTGDKDGVSAALPLKYPAAVHSDASMSSPSHKKPEGNQSKVLSTLLGSSRFSGGLPEENANTELRESDSLRCSGKTNDLEDILTGNMVVQADDKTKPAKHHRKKISLKHVSTDDGKDIQSSGEQINQVTTKDLKVANATKSDLVQGSSVIGTSASTVGKVQRKSKRSSKTRTPKIQEVNHSTHGRDSHFTKDSQDEYVIDIGGSHDNENAGAPTKSPVIQKDATTLKSASSNARKGWKKSSKTELQNQDSALEHGSDANLMNSKVEWGTVCPKSSADAVEPSDHVVVHHDNDKISFLEHFSPREMNDPSVSAENKENNEDETIREVKDKKKRKRKPDMQSQSAGSIEPNDPLESHLRTDKTSLTDHFGTENVGMPSVTSENMNRQDGNMKKVKDKKKSKRKSDLVKPVSEQVNTNGDNQDTDNCTQDLLYSVVQKARMEQDSGKENSDQVTQNDSLLQLETEDATCDSTLEKKLLRSKFNADSQNNLPIDKDHGHMSKEQRKSTSQIKHHAKSRNDDGSINLRTGSNTKAVSNLVKSFSMSPPASGDSTVGMPQNANRYRVVVRKVPRKRYEQTSDKSKKDNSKRGTGAIFSDAISEGSDDALDTMIEKAAMETSSDGSSTSADSGISSAAHDGSDVPDDDSIVSLSQKSRKEGLHIGSILRGSSSYKKARQKQTEQLDDTEVPDSQPADGL